MHTSSHLLELGLPVIYRATTRRRYKFLLQSHVAVGHGDSHRCIVIVCVKKPSTRSWRVEQRWRWRPRHSVTTGCCHCTRLHNQRLVDQWESIMSSRFDAHNRSLLTYPVYHRPIRVNITQIAAFACDALPLCRVSTITCMYEYAALILYL